MVETAEARVNRTLAGGLPLELPADELAALELLRRAAACFGSRLTLSCSFGGAGGMVLLDMLSRVHREHGLGPPDVFVLDTELLFDETYRLIEQCEQRYGLSVRRVRPLRTVAEQATDEGEMLWRSNPDRCCALRKVEPMRRAVAGYDAWVTAIRRDQTSARASSDRLMWDEQFGLWKVCPLVAWDEARVLNYVFEHDLPVSPLLGAGYTSIGCVPCTRKATGGGRSGRWLGTGKVECGLHARPATPGTASSASSSPPHPAGRPETPVTLTVQGDGDRI